MKIIFGLLALVAICNSCPSEYTETTSYSSGQSTSAARECHTNCKSVCIITTPQGTRFMGYTCVPDYIPGDTMIGRFYDCCCKYGGLQYCYNC